MRKPLIVFVCGLVCACLATLLFVFFRNLRKVQESPNVIFILLDAARADHFSCYGYKKKTTPRMDLISEKGVLFANNFSQATGTDESLPGIFFSRYFSAPIFNCHPVWKIRRESPRTVFKRFDDQHSFLTSILSSHDYRTAIFHNHGVFTEGDYLLQGFHESYFFPSSKRHASDKKTISSLISWIEKNKKTKFFIYCHIMSPHQPYPPKEENNEFLPGVDPSAIEATKEKFHGRGACLPKGWNSEDGKIHRGLYDGNLKHTDRWIGALYESLKNWGLEDKTLFIITADHGENLGEHNKLSHGGLPWDSVTRVPLIMVYPPLIPPGGRVSGLTESIDIMPTILDICGIELPKGKSMDGISLVKFMDNPEMGKEAVFTKESVRTKKYSYIVGKDLLFDLKKDPGETRNIAERNPAIKERLRAKFEKTMRPYGNRHENSKRENPPDFPFYFSIDVFKIDPKEVFEKCWIRKNVLESAAPKKTWLLNTYWETFGLFCLPANGSPPPITLSSSLPDGTYRVSLLLEPPHRISHSPKRLGFRFRSDTRKPFVLPRRIDFARRHEGAFFYYLRLGKVKVDKNFFSLQISFHPRDEHPYVIRHIRFDPGKSREKAAEKDPDEEDLPGRTESLKALGYL